MKDFAMQLTQKCVSMGLLDESYSEWFAYSIEKRVTTLFTWLVQCLIGGFCFGWTLTIFIFCVLPLNSEIHKRLSCCYL